MGRAPLLGTLEDTLRKAPDMGISLHRGPFMSEGNLESGGGRGSHILGTLNDEQRRALGMGQLSLRGLHEGSWREGSFTGAPEDMLKSFFEVHHPQCGTKIAGSHSQKNTPHIFGKSMNNLKMANISGRNM